uniref:Uncharacterized protein n=1 Tax=Clytia hemisphaerica TaxID=252671 RepID=A0A7M6DRN9_9CNID|eukprot:TCONS_00000337-protein
MAATKNYGCFSFVCDYFKKCFPFVKSKKSSPTRIRYVPPAHQHASRKTSSTSVQHQERRRLSSNDSYSGRKHSNNELHPGRKISNSELNAGRKHSGSKSPSRSPNISPNRSNKSRKVSSVSKKLSDAIDLDDTSRKSRYVAKVSITNSEVNPERSPVNNKMAKNHWKRGMTIIKERKANVENDKEMKDIA